ncbi:sulfite oxidase [Phreatobacter oligotrophus]|uniref:Sulfite dehydrogenase (Cytochrome) subunit SorA apoprotein n=1 Tax=Phreatobacter oligotrophus TaxID=1122261 RepID=A0A2T4ZHV7_9HYPH|nr:sulfite oxidase [Phreatobacter oligotrophus]PTM61578.1 sulfite dehydrogenase (cytochrome) subunit SorA apoprotein [Phreatobacter oligotrophus]
MHKSAEETLSHRPSGLSRRGAMGASLATIAAVTGGASLAGMPRTALAQSAPAPAAAPARPAGPQPFDFPGKERGLKLLGDRPLVAETPEALLDDDTTPIAKFFIRNNGQIPAEITDRDGWRFTVEGEVERPLTLSVAELKSRFQAQTFRMVLECGGNGRSFFQPAARGNQWTNGGAGCAEWTGVRLADVLQAAGLKPTAKFTGHFGADPHLSGDTDKDAISRGMPIEKALEPHSLIVWQMNGEPLPHIHGGPLRLVVPGWPASLSSKWLKRILVRATPHDGQGMGGTSYRMPTQPIIPGSNVDGKTNFADMTSMPLRAIITAPANGTRLPEATRHLPLRGAAWAGDYEVAKVEVSADAGQRWQTMTLSRPRNRYDWVRWTGTVELPTAGYYELWVRATDSRGIAQPHVATNWNPQGYGANPLHRVAVLVG